MRLVAAVADRDISSDLPLIAIRAATK